ncbi:MAG: hypothetical protein K2K28_01710 [Clostridia bacterium]|nr:hypothetical protein [Clostridia bacterium]
MKSKEVLEMTVYELLSDRYYDNDKNGDYTVSPLQFAFMIAVLNYSR